MRLIAIASLLGCLALSGCTHQGTASSQATPAQQSGISAFSPSSRTWLQDKVRQAKGSYKNLSDSDRRQFDMMSQGHGEMLFNQARR